MRATGEAVRQANGIAAETHALPARFAAWFTAHGWTPHRHQLALPAFGANAGGLDVCDPAIELLLRRDYTVMALGRTQVHAISRRILLRPAPDRAAREPRLL